ncbi:MAG: DUF4173 domain-containing protein [Micromonosporaceae bacterium]|nr:DUF4173 domain-containing protein [Micromonosporaceae bacterium]
MTQAPPQPPIAHAPQPVKRGKGPGWRFWPDVRDGAPWQVFAVAGLAAGVTLLTEPYAVVGIAGLLTGLVVAAGPAMVVVTSRAARQRLLRPLPLLALAATLALLAVGTIRATPWLYVLCVLAALGLSSYGLAAGRRWPSVLMGGLATWAGALRGLPWLIRGIGRGPTTPGATPSTRSTAASVGRAVLVAAITAVLLLVFGSLLASADAAFARALSGFLPEISAPDVFGRAFMAAWVTVFALGAAFVARVPPRLDRLGGAGDGRVRPMEWAVPVGALALLFAAFTAVQFAVLFGGDEHVQVTPGLTYADYARSGFGQLVLVTLLTLAVLAAVGRWAPREQSKDRTLVRAVAGALCLLTLVIVASALYRMHLYQEAYGFTRLRVVVTVFELWLGGLFVLILAAGARLRGGWLPRAVVGTGAAALLGLAALNPDAFIAERNVARYEQTGKIDTQYLGQLSADAVPALDRLPEPLRSCAVAPIASDLAAPDEPWHAYNISRERARQLLRDRPTEVSRDCPSRY